MSKVDYRWILEQLQGVRAKQGVGDAVMALLKTWETLEIPEEFAEEALQMFAQLAVNHALLPPNGGEEVWVPAQPGQIKVADIVRVRTDAFTGPAGIIHNGRLGKVVGVRYGDILVRTTDNKKPQIDGTHYPPSKLEKRIK